MTGENRLVVGNGVLQIFRAELGVVGVGWVLTWRRARMCRTDTACRAPSRLGTAILGVATGLVVLALIWQPMVEPWALSLIRSARG